MKKKPLYRIITITIMCLTLLAGCSLLAGFTGEEALAKQQPQNGAVVLQNESGDKLLLKVEEQLKAEERALQSEAEGVVDLAEESVPLAGFDPLGPGDFGMDQIHTGWMILLLAAAAGYAAYFTRYQSRLFDLRRDVAAAEHELFRKDRQ